MDISLNLLPKPQMRKHSNFFSSLKQVEKRLKSEDQPPPPPAPPQQQKQPPQDCISNDTCSTDSLSSPIYLHSYRPNQSSTLPGNSEAAPAFLSSSPPFPSTPHEDPPPEIKNPEQRDEFEANPDEDSIRRLIELLGLSDLQEKEGNVRERDGEGLVSDYDCESGFYSKIVGVKGPKCGKEVERLEGWIKHLKNGGDEIIEPLRLAHLLLGKAALTSEEEGAGCGYGGLDFPATIDEFLHNDSPTSW